MHATTTSATENGLALEPGTGPADLAVVVPTFNERDNIEPLVAELGDALSGEQWEVIFVDDDSPDGTWQHVAELARHDHRLKLVRRVGRRGLASAVVEGIRSSSAPYVAVMDADGQHDPALLPPMLKTLRDGTADVAVGVRAGLREASTAWTTRRRLISRAGAWLSRRIIGTDLSDPMSGFFALRRATFDSAAGGLALQGYKILIDILTSLPAPLRLVELPYRFRARRSGDSKLDVRVGAEYLVLLAGKAIGRVVPVRFLLFSFVGGIGVIVHFATFVSLGALGLSFTMAQAGATFLAMTGNFFCNNMLTYRDRRLQGLSAIGIGLASFYLACSVGAVINVAAARALFLGGVAWWLASAAGIVVGAVWNYIATSVLTWREARASPGS